MVRKEHVVESVSAKDDLIAMTSGKLIDRLKDLIPGVLRHQPNKRIQADDRLFIEMAENGRRESISVVMLTSGRMNIRSWFKKRIDRHRNLLARL